MKNLTPLNDRVLIEYIAIKDMGNAFKPAKGGKILTLNGEVGGSADVSKSGVKYEARIKAIGEKVDTTSIKWKVGDKIIFNEYDIMKLEDEDGNIWGLTKAESIWATYE